MNYGIRDLIYVFLITSSYITALMFSLLIFTLVLAAGNSYYNSYVLIKAGYPTKVIGVTCFAYYGNRWVSCDSVLGNQIELVKQETE